MTQPRSTIKFPPTQTRIRRSFSRKVVILRWKRFISLSKRPSFVSICFRTDLRAFKNTQVNYNSLRFSDEFLQQSSSTQQRVSWLVSWAVQSMDKLQIDSILVVDDDPTLRELLVDYLSGNGFDVTAVADGIAMRSVLDTHPFELIVLDLMLPGEDGLSLTRFLRSKTHIPILMLSAQSEDVDRIIG